VAKRGKVNESAWVEGYRAALGAAEIGVFRWHFGSDRVEWDETMYRLFQIPAGHQIRHLEDGLAWVHPEDRVQVQAAAEAAVLTHAHIDLRFRCREELNGAIRWLWGRGKVFYDAEGHPLFAAGTCQEITPLQEEETVIPPPNKALLQHVTAAVPVLISYVDRNLRYQYVSAAYERWFHRPLEEIQGQPVWAVLGEAAFAVVAPYIKRALAGETVVYTEELPLQGLGLRYVHVQYIPDGTPEQVRGYTVVVTDLSELQVLSKRQAQLAALVESSTDAIISYDVGGRVQSWNPAAEQLYGYTAKEMVGQSLDRLVPPDRQEEAAQALARIQQGQPVATYESVRRHKDGTFIPVSLTVSPIKDAKGQLIGISKIARDISARKQAEAKLYESERKLQEANQRKDDFLATLAHELRNPLAPIASALELLNLANCDAVVQAEAVQIAKRQLQHLTHLVEDLLDVSRITRGKIELRRKRVAIADMVQSALETSRPALETVGHRLTVNMPEMPLWVKGDFVRLAQVVSNLLINAAKYTPAGGHIQLAVRQEGDELAIAVQDNGRGISAAFLPRLFDMFSQAKFPSGQVGGLGVGLPLVKGLVELHGGWVTAASAGPGQGSTFTVRLPLLKGAAPSAGAALSASFPEKARARRILVVDDNEDAADTLAKLLGVLGHTVQVAYDGQSALEKARACPPEVVLLDLGLPGMDGWEVAKHLRQLLAGKEIMLIALTGWGQETDRQRTREAGFDHHLVKPVEFQTLAKLLNGEPLA
jgi:PAS domain S-box-containing protein